MVKGPRSVAHPAVTQTARLARLVIRLMTDAKDTRGHGATFRKPAGAAVIDCRA